MYDTQNVPLVHSFFPVCMVGHVFGTPFYKKGDQAPFLFRIKSHIDIIQKFLIGVTIAIQSMVPHPDKPQGSRRNGWSKDLATVALIVAFAGNADAFRPLTLRTITPSTKIVSGRPQLPTLGLRQDASKPRFLFGLRAAVAETFSREKMYQLAQVGIHTLDDSLIRTLFIFIFFIITGEFQVME
jgi:hypothetical protein